MAKINQPPTPLQQQNAQAARGSNRPAGVNRSRELGELAVSELEAGRSALGADGTGGSLLGPLAGEAGGTAFSLLGTSVAGQQGGLVSDFFGSPARFSAPGSPQWHTETGHALDKANTLLEQHANATLGGMLRAASQIAQQNPQLVALAAQAAKQTNNTSNNAKGPALRGANQEAASNSAADPTAPTTQIYNLVQTNAPSTGVDLSQMPIEDAVVMMMMLLDMDAQSDMRDKLTEMQATQKKRAAMADALTKLKGEQTRMQEDLQKKYNALTPKQQQGQSFDEWSAAQNVQMPSVSMDYTTGQATLTPGQVFDTPTSGSSAGTSAPGGASAGVAAPEGSANADAAPGAPTLLSARAGDEVTTVGGGTGKFGDLDANISSLSDQKDAVTDVTGQQQLQMQMIMDRMQKADEAASNLQKKMSDILNQIIGNTK